MVSPSSCATEANHVGGAGAIGRWFGWRAGMTRTLLGEGGFAKVYRESLPDGSVRVVKVVETPTQHDVRRAEHEARILANATHFCIPAFYGWARLDGTCELTIEFVGSRSLFDVITSTDPLPAGFASAVFACVSSALAHLYAIRVAHLDVKSENVVVGDDGRICLVDFNLAYEYARGEPLVVSLGSCGTTSHAAPEVLARVPFNAYQADAWSFGILCFSVVHRRLPFHQATPDDSRYTQYEKAQSHAGACAALDTLYPGKLSARCHVHAALLDGLLRVDPATRIPMSTALSLATAAVQMGMP